MLPHPSLQIPSIVLPHFTDLLLLFNSLAKSTYTSILINKIEDCSRTCLFADLYYYLAITKAKETQIKGMCQILKAGMEMNPLPLKYWLIPTS